MKTQINEIKRMQLLAGVINESQLNEEKIPFFHLKQVLTPFGIDKPKADQMADLRVGLKVLPKQSYRDESDIKAALGKITKIEGDNVTVKKVNGNEENRKISDLIHLIDGGYQFESQLNEEEIKSVDQVLDTPKTQEISKKLSQDPALLQKSIDQLSKLGIDKNTLMKAAQAHSSGKDVGNIIDDKVETAVEKVNEASGFTDGGKMLTGLAAGLTGLSLVGGLPVLAAAVILALVGAGAAVVGSKIDYKQQQQAESLDQLDEVVDKVLAKLRSAK